VNVGIDCHKYRGYDCSIDGVQLALSVVTMAFAYLYFALFFLYLIQSIIKLRSLPRHDHKMSHLSVRLQASPRQVSFLCMDTNVVLVHANAPTCFIVCLSVQFLTCIE